MQQIICDMSDEQLTRELAWATDDSDDSPAFYDGRIADALQAEWDLRFPEPWRYTAPYGRPVVQINFGDPEVCDHVNISVGFENEVPEREDDLHIEVDMDEDRMSIQLYVSEDSLVGEIDWTWSQWNDELHRR